MFQLPIIHIDRIAKELGVSRDWINRKWLNADDPPPSFRDGDSVFFELEELKTWAKRRALGSGFIDTKDDPLD